MKKELLVKILSLLSVSMALSQNAQKVMPPSPTASALAQYSNVPTNNYTGVPSISVPLYAIKSGEIELPISLSYHASGIKVSQEASWVGLGWALNAGGVITRSVSGVDDFKPIYGYANVSDLPLGDPLQYIDSYRQINTGIRDGQPDTFYYNFLGQSGKMIIAKKENGTNKIKGIPLKQTNVTFVYDMDKKEWEVTDGNGWKYYFNVNEISRNYSSSDIDNSSPYFPYKESSGRFLYQLDRLDGNSYSDQYISAWYIKKIETPKGDSIIFEYDNAEERKSIGQLSFYEQESYYGTPLIETLPSNTWYGFFTERKHSVSATMPSSDNINLKKIIFKSGYIQFNTSDKEDQRQHRYMGIYYPKSQKLDSFEVFNLSNESIKKVQLDYSYFNENSTGTNKENFWRLKLNGVQEFFYDTASSVYKSNPPFLFSYNSISLPAKTSASIDHWGYYNGFDNDNVKSYQNVTQELYHSNGNYDFIQNPVVIQDEPYFSYKNIYKYFMPFQIQCNKSSRTTYYPFLDGAYMEPDANLMQAGMLTKISYPTGGSTKFFYEPNSYEAGADQDFYRCEYNTFWVNHEGFGDADEKNFTLNYHTIVKIQANINNSGSLSYYNNLEALIEKSTGEDVIRFIPNKSDFKGNYQLILPPGDYRLKAKTNGPTSIVNISMGIEFVQQFSTDRKIGGGLRIFKQESLDKDQKILLRRVYNYNAQGTNTWTSGRAMSDIQHFYRDAELDRSLLNSYPGEVLDRNNVIVRSSGNNTPLSSSAQGNFVGYAQVSVSDEDLIGNKIGRTVSYYSNMPDDAGAFKLPGFPVITHMNNGDLIREDYYNKSEKIVKTIENTYLMDSASSFSVTGIFTRNVLKDLRSGSSGDEFFILPYKIYSEWWHPEKTIETAYDLNGQNPVITTTNYDFENTLHKNITKTTTTNSKGQTVISKNKYPQDMPFGIDETPSTVVSGMITANILNPVIQSEKTVDGKMVEGMITNFDVKAYSDESNNSKNMYLAKNIKDIKGGSAVGYEKKFDFISYGKYGKLTAYQQTDGGTIVYLWGYKEEYPVAKVEGSWLSAVEGVFTAAELSNIKNGTYNQAAMITVLNKIRSTLPNAIVTTYTYKSLVGASSITDPKGVTTYYEYDSSNRLAIIKDHDLNILQTFCYNYQGQLVDCPTVNQIPTVRGLSLTGSTTTTLNFTWNAVSGATGYKIYKNGVYVSSVATTSGSLSGLSGGTTYNVQVLAYNVTGEGTPCPVVLMATSAAISNACSMEFAGSVNATESCILYKNNSAYLTRTTSGISNGTFAEGDTFYIALTADQEIYDKNIRITSSVRGVLFNGYASNGNGNVLNSGIFTKIGSEVIAVTCSTTFRD